MPIIYWKGFVNEFEVVVMTKLQWELASLFNLCGKQFSDGTILKIGLELINALQSIHEYHVIHRDLKPHNIMFDVDTKKNGCKKLYLVDFGLSRSFYDHTNQTHYGFIDGLGPIGTTRYASIWAHKGYAQSRRDDMQCVLWLLIYFKNGMLPWQTLPKTDAKTLWNQVGEMKAQFDWQSKTLPIYVSKMADHICNLNFSQEPNYKLLREIINEEATQRNFLLDDNFKYDWEVADIMIDDAKTIV